jgi:hypothetical protein
LTWRKDHNRCEEEKEEKDEEEEEEASEDDIGTFVWAAMLSLLTMVLLLLLLLLLLLFSSCLESTFDDDNEGLECLPNGLTPQITRLLLRMLLVVPVVLRTMDGPFVMVEIIGVVDVVVDAAAAAIEVAVLAMTIPTI